MKTNEVIREVMNRKDIGPTELANRMGKPARLISDRLRIENLSMEKLNETLRLMGYKIIAVPIETAVPEDGIVVD